MFDSAHDFISVIYLETHTAAVISTVIVLVISVCALALSTSVSSQIVWHIRMVLENLGLSLLWPPWQVFTQTYGAENLGSPKKKKVVRTRAKQLNLMTKAEGGDEVVSEGG